MRGDRRLFRDLSFSITPGTLLQLTGPNGSGKTSLLRILAGLSSPESGAVRWAGTNIRSLAEDYSQHVAYIGHRNGVKEELSSLENLRISSGLGGFTVTTSQAREALQRMGLKGREDLPTRFLSEGQRRRSALARLITGNATLWLLDEVLASLDESARSLIESVISGHLSDGGMAVVATHQPLQVAGNKLQQLELSDASTGRRP